jgi:multidrug resistance efflux pump
MSQAKFNKAIKDVSAMAEAVKEQFLPLFHEFTYDKLSELAQQLAEKQEEFDKLQVDFNERKRAFDVEFKLKQQADEKAVLENLSKKYNYAMISVEEYQTMRNELAEAEKTAAAKVAEATKALESSLSSKFALDNKDNEVKAAQAEAEIRQLQERNSFLENQMQQLRKDLQAQREVTVKVAESAGNSKSNITLTK